MISESGETLFFFANPLSSWHYLAIALASSAILFFLAKDLLRRLSLIWTLGLVSLRVLILAAIFILLIDPVHYRDQSQNEDWLALLLDTSASMAAPGSESSLSHLQKDLKRIETSASWTAIAAKHPIRIFQFDKTVQPLLKSEAAQVTQNATNLIGALTKLDRDYGGDPNFMGTILISDGNTTDWQASSENTLKKLRQGVLTLSTGNASQPFNLSLGPLEIKEHAFIGQILSLRVTWTQIRAAPETARLTVSLKGEVLFSQDVSIAAGEVLIPIPVKTEGILPLEAVLEAPIREIFTADNFSKVWINAQKRKIRVFYAESYYSHENSFKQALEEDADFEVDFATSLVGFAKEKRVPFLLDPLYGFPSSKEKFFLYDALVLSDVKRSLLKPEQMDWIEEWVKDRGGALIMVGGMDSFGDGGYCKSKLEQLLPVEISEDYQNDTFLKARGVVEQPFRIKLASGALDHPLLQITGKANSDQRLWEEMPPLGGYNYVGRVKPGATLLWQHPTDKSKFGPRAILAVQRFGQGQVMAFTSDITPNWGTEFLSWKSTEEGWIYARFWREALKWMTVGRLQQLTKPFEIQRVPRLATADDPVEFQLRVPETIRQVRIDFSLQSEGQPHSRRTFYGSPQTGPVTWNAGVLPPGVYELHTTLTVEGTGAVMAQDYFTVHPSRKEADHLLGDDELLKRIAAWTGGDYLTETQWNRLEQAVLKMSQRSMKSRAEPIWNKLWIYLTILAMLCAEWFIRKKKGFES